MQNIKKKVLSMFSCMLMLVAIGSISIAEEKPDETPTLEYFPQSHDFGEMYEGETDSTTFEIWMGGCCGILSYLLAENCSWIDVSPTSGTSEGEHDTITVSIDTTDLELGLHTSSIFIESNGGDGLFDVIVTIIKLSYYPRSHDFGDMFEGEIDNATFEIWNRGSDTLSYNLIEHCSWIDVFPTSGTSQGEHDTITVSINTTGLYVGPHTTSILIESNGGTGVFNVTVDIKKTLRIEIGDITGGLFKIHAVIKNTGNLDAHNVSWNITLNGGSILLGKKTSDVSPKIRTGKSVTVSSKLILGFGKTVVTVDAGIPESSDTKEQDASVLLFFIKT